MKGIIAVKMPRGIVISTILAATACTVPTRDIHVVDDFDSSVGSGGSGGKSDASTGDAGGSAGADGGGGTSGGSGGATGGSGGTGGGTGGSTGGGPGTGGNAGSGGSGGTGGAAGKSGSGGTAGVPPTGGSGGTGGAAGTGGSGGTGGAAGKSGSGGTAGGGPGTGGSAGKAGGAGTGGSGGTGGTLPDSGPPPPGCTSQTPAGTRMCGANETCFRSSCGPPPTYACYPAGTTAEGGACMYSDECTVGSLCLSYRSDLSVCRKMCTLDADCASGYRCLGSSTACDPPIAGSYCQKLCSNITAAGASQCGAGFKCDITCNATGANPALCLLAGSLTAGSCTQVSDCAPGYTCFDSICTQTCVTNTDCTAGGTCTQEVYCNGTTNTGYKVCKTGALTSP